MARLWQSGFGLQSTTGAIEFSSISAGVSIQSTVTRTGPFALRTNPAAAVQFVRYHGFASDQSTAGFQRFYLRIASAPGANTTICRFVNAANDPCSQLRLTSSRTLILLDAGGDQVGSASSALTLDTWYLVELGVDASSSPGTVTGRLNGSTFATGNNSAQSPWARWLIGPIVSATCDLYFADWAVNDSSGSAQTSWPGEGVVVTLHPDAAGDSNAWNNTSNAAGSANNYLLVDEAPPDDATTMVQTGTLNAEDSYNCTASGMGAGDTVNCVMVGGRFRNSTADATAAARLQIRKAAAGTTTQSADLIPNSTSFRTNANAEPRNYPIILHNDPDGSAWTQTTVDSMQIGVKLTTAGTQRIQFTSVWAVVDYTPSTGTNANASAATGSGAANQPSASIKPSAGNASGAATAYNAYGGSLYETFDSYPTSAAWSEGSTVNLWRVEFVGTDGQVVPVDAGGEGRVLQLQAHDNASTSASLVVCNHTTTGDVGYRVRLQTVEQLRSPTPNPWEVAWFCWNYTEPASDVRRFYYVALKTNGIELGKVDQSTTFPGGQRFLFTDGTAHSLGTWYTVDVLQTGANIRVWVDGTLRVDFTDGVGSGGTPAWGTSGEIVMTSGAVALYHEDARVQFGEVMYDPPPQTATGTGTALDAAPAVAPTAGHASGTGSAFDATVSTSGNNTNANAEAATGTGSAGNAAAAVAPAAQAAAGTGSAGDATAQVSPTAQAATGTGTAGTPSAAIAPPAGAATGTGAAFDATAVTGAVGLAEAATGSGTAHPATIKVSTSAQAAAATAAAHQASPSVAPSAGHASGTGTAFDATVAVENVAPAEAATGTGQASDATTKVSPTAQAAAGTGTANDATALTGTVAVAGAASATGVASDAAPSVGPTAGPATGTGAAHDATTTITTTAQPATGTGAALDPAARVAPSAQAATGTGAAFDASALTGTIATAGQASGTGTAGNATAAVAPTAATASGTGLANDAATAIAPTAVAAFGAGTAHDPASHVAPTGQHAAGIGAGLDGTTTVAPSAGHASGAGAAGAPAASVAPTAAAAEAAASALSPSPSIAPAAGAAAGTGAAFDATVTTLTGTQANAQAASGTGSAFDATVIAVSEPATPATPTSDGWSGLLSILQDAQAAAEAERPRQPQACPNDGEPLRDGPDGQPYCPWDGWRPDGSYVAAAAEYAPIAPGVSESLFADTDDMWS